MDFNLFKNNLIKLSSFEVGGIDAQFKLAPKIRTKYTESFVVSQKPKKAAVLVLFYPNEQGKTTFLLTKSENFVPQNGPSTQLIDATSFV